jgi:hypothetical protein
LIEDIYCQSPSQEVMFLESLRSPGSGVNVIQLVWTLSGAMNVVAFEQAWKQIIARHSIMRTSFVRTRKNKALQVVRSCGDPDLSYVDCRELSEFDRHDRLNALLKADARRGFEFSKSAPLRFYLLQISAAEHWFVWSIHHLLLDRWSLSNIVQELFASYAGFRTGRPVRLERSRPYGEYIAWLQKQDPSKSETFWREQLKGFKAPTSLDWALKPEHLRARDGGPSGSVDVKHVTIPADTCKRIERVAREHRLMLSTLVQAAWALVLSHYSGSSDVVFGVVLSGRSVPVVGIAAMVGPFLSVLPMRVRIAPTQVLLSCLRRPGDPSRYF